MIWLGTKAVLSRLKSHLSARSIALALCPVVHTSGIFVAQIVRSSAIEADSQL